MNRRVLWIDDEIYKIGDLAEGLKSKGIKVFTASTEKEWNEYFKKESGYFNLIILDIRLPKAESIIEENSNEWESRGECLLKRIRQIWSQTSILVFTAKPTRENKDKILKLGANEYLEKPVLVSEFEEAVFRILDLA